jgi:hypothetical protein
MRFVVKATGRTGNVCWLTEPGLDGFRTISVRNKAGLFATETEARVAIATMPQPFDTAGIIFSVQSADGLAEPVARVTA